MAFQLSDALNKDKVFLVKRSELEERLDCEYYNPSHYRDLALLGNSPYSSLRLKDVCVRIVDGPFGSAIKADDYVDNGIPFIRVADVTHGEGTINYDNLIFISHEAHKEIARSKVIPGDVVIAKTGATMGAASVVPDYIPEANIRGDLAALTLLKDRCSAEYAITYINTQLGQRLFWRLDSGGTRGRVVIGNLKKYPFVIPPHEIQNRIVAKMNTAHAAKKQKEAQAQQLLDSIDTYLLNELGIEPPPEEENSISQRMFIRTFSEISGGRFDPEYFKEEYVRHEKAVHEGTFKPRRLGDFITSIAYGASVNNEYEASGIPLLRIKDLQPNEINSEKTVFLPESMRREIGNAFVKCGDFLISRSGSLGVTAIVGEAHDGFAFGSFMIKFDIVENEVIKLFVSYILNSYLGKIYFKRNKIGAIQGNITIPVIKSCPVPLPPLEKQNEIVAQIQNIRDQAKQLRAEAATGLKRAKREVEAMIVGRQ